MCVFRGFSYAICSAVGRDFATVLTRQGLAAKIAIVYQCSTVRSFPYASWSDPQGTPRREG